MFSAFYAISNPPFEAPDEPGHLAYINYVAKSRELPDQSHPRRSVDGEGHQHPLYYVLAALLPAAYTPWDRVNNSALANPDSVLAGGKDQNVPVHLSVLFERDEDREAFYLLRLLSSLFVALTVLVVGLAARLCLRADLHLLPPLIVATLPQFQFAGGSISNDAIACLAAALVTYCGIKALQIPLTRRWIAFGLLIGFAVLVKKSNLIFVPVGLALPFLASRDAIAFKRFGWTALPAVLLIAPLLLRNMSLYGDLLGSQMERETLQALVAPKPLWSTYFLKAFPLAVLESFYAHFGWMNVHVFPLLHLVFYVVLLAPLAYLRRQARELKVELQAFFCGAIVVLAALALVGYNLTFTQPQGRLLFPALPALALLWGVGMSRFAASIRYVAVLFALMDVFCAFTNWSFYR